MTLTDDIPFEPAPMFGALAGNRVDYVLIGGMAAIFHGAPAFTGDVDICPSRAQENLERLAAALVELEARIRTAGEPVATRITAGLLERMAMVNTVTPYGLFDISFEPAATGGYEDLVTRAVTHSMAGVAIRVASLDDVIRSKETANREKDRLWLPTLYALQDEIAQRDEQESER
jgi:hypothetical protein